MNKYLLLSIGVFLLMNVSAVSIIAGQNYTWDFSNQAQTINNISVQIINNNSNLDGLNFIINVPNVTMTTDPLYKSDNFTIIFTINGENVVTDSVGSGGSGGSQGCVTKWTCSDWGQCTNGIQNRTCQRIPPYCGSYENKPNTSQKCSILPEKNETQENQTNQTPPSKPNETYPEPLTPIQSSAIVVLLVALIYTIIHFVKKKKGIKEDNQDE